MTETLLPHTFTGTSTGTWTLLPEPTPGEPPVWPSAEEPPGLPGFPESETLAHLLPIAGFSSPTALTVFPQAFTGTCTGTWTEFPDATPGEFTAAPFAPESACA